MSGEYNDLTVSTLINKEDSCWKREFITDLVVGEMVEIICKLPFSKMGQKDRLIWEASADGEFSVCSAYRIEFRRKRREKEESSRWMESTGLWRKI